MSVHPAALDFRQGVEGVPQTEKHFFPIQELLGAGLVQTRGVFDPVIAVQGIKRLVPGKPPLIGRFIPPAGQKHLGHFIGHLHQLVHYVPIIKIFHIDCSHNLSSILFRWVG